MRQPISVVTSEAVLLAALVVLATAPSVAEACMCGQGSCSTVLTAGSLFEATVVALDAPPPGAPTGETVVRLSDVRMIRGRAPARLVVDGSSCGYEFTVGTRYLIDADRVVGGAGSASHCGATRPLARTSGIRAFMTAAAADRPRVWGTLTAQTTSHRQDAGRGGGPPVAGAIVTLSGPVQRTVATSANGEFAFVQVPDGQYRLMVEIPGSRADVSSSEEREFTLGPGSACVSFDMLATSTARVVGRIVDPRGAPVSGVQVELYSPGFNVFDRDFVRLPGGTDAAGAFEVAQVPPGRFVVGIGVPRPRADMPYAPAQAQVDGQAVFEVRPGAVVELPPIVARRAVPVTVRGVLEGLAGGPRAGVAVVVSQFEAPEAGRWRLGDTDASGRFSLELLRGVRYRVEARDGDRIVAQTEVVAGDAPLVLTVRPSP